MALSPPAAPPARRRSAIETHPLNEWVGPRSGAPFSPLISMRDGPDTVVIAPLTIRAILLSLTSAGGRMKPRNPKPTPLTIRLSTKSQLVQDVAETRLEDLIGCTGYQGPARTLEEMEAGIARGARSQGSSTPS
jgi:hypothetical protein